MINKKDKIIHRKNVFFIGTIAELIKTFPVMLEMRSRGIPFDIISSGQNNLSIDSIMQVFDIPKPVFTIRKSTKKQTPVGLLFWTVGMSIIGIFRVGYYVLTVKPKYFIIHGDTVSTAVGAILGRLFFRKVVHIEAGCRSGNLFRPFPEEIDRIISDFFSSVYACPNKEAYDNLKGKRGLRINCHYNTAVDALWFAQKELKDATMPIKELKGKKYFTWVMHRPENVGDKEYVHNMVDIISTILEENKKLSCLFYLHSNTKSGLINFDLLNKIESLDRLTITNRVSFIPNVNLISKSEFMISDGGGNQQECYFLGKPCVTARKETETPDGIGKNGILSVDKKEILDFVSNYADYIKPPTFPKVFPHKIIIDKLEENV